MTGRPELLHVLGMQQAGHVDACNLLPFLVLNRSLLTDCPTLGKPDLLHQYLRFRFCKKWESIRWLAAASSRGRLSTRLDHSDCPNFLTWLAAADRESSSDDGGAEGVELPGPVSPLLPFALLRSPAAAGRCRRRLPMCLCLCLKHG